MRTHVIRFAAAVAALGLAAPLAHASTEAPPATKPARSCFASNTWNGWTPAPGGDALYIRVGLRDIYRVELTPGTHARKSPGEFLVNKVRGSNWICSALDLDLAISDTNGFRQPLIARDLRKLSAAEVAAIPRKDLP